LQKRTLLTALIVIVSISFVLGSALEVEAQETQGLDAYLGLSFNTYNLSEFEEINYEDHGVDEDVSSGLSFYAGAEYDLEEEGIEDLKAGAELEYMSVEYSDLDLSLSNLGIMATASYRLSGIDEDLPDELYLTGAAGVYRSNLVDEEVDKGVKDETFMGPGFKLGIKGSTPVYENISLGGRAHYRYARPHSEGDIDFSGLEIGAYLDASF